MLAVFGSLDHLLSLIDKLYTFLLFHFLSNLVILKLEKLVCLNLSENKIIEIPSLSKMFSLEILYLNDNKLEEFPKNISKNVTFREIHAWFR